MKDRLIELIRKAHDKQKYLTSDKSINAIADYLLENGVIVPPCNIGQTVYAVDKRSKLWWKGTMFSFCYTKNCIEYGVLFDDGEIAIYSQDCVFLTREDAEKALKEGGQG